MSTIPANDLNKEPLVQLQSLLESMLSVYGYVLAGDCLSHKHVYKRKTSDGQTTIYIREKEGSSLNNWYEIKRNSTILEAKLLSNLPSSTVLYRFAPKGEVVKLAKESKELSEKLGFEVSVIYTPNKAA